MSFSSSEQLNELAAALSKAQAAIRPAIKESVNPHFKSKYADLAAIWAACREPLTQNGLAVVQLPVDAEAGRAALTTMLLHSSGQFISATTSVRLVKDDAQGMGSALTYLRRYGLAAMVGVVADDDDDGNAAVARPRTERDDLEPLRNEIWTMAEQIEAAGLNLGAKEQAALEQLPTMNRERLERARTYFAAELDKVPPRKVA